MSDVPPNFGAPPPFTPPTGSPGDANDRQLAMITWILSIVTGFLGPLIIYLVSKDKPFVRRHAATALTGSLILFVLYLALYLPALPMFMSGKSAPGMSFGVIFFGGMMCLFVVVGLSWLVTEIKGAIAANNGQEFDPNIVTPIRNAIFKP